MVAKRLANLPANRPADNCANLRISQDEAAKPCGQPSQPAGSGRVFTAEPRDGENWRRG